MGGQKSAKIVGHHLCTFPKVSHTFKIELHSGHALEISICGCSLFYRRELWASKSASFNSTKSLKSVGAKGDVPKIYGFVHPLHKGAFCQFPFRSIYNSGSNRSTEKETGKTHLCALHCTCANAFPVLKPFCFSRLLNYFQRKKCSNFIISQKC